MNAEIIGGSIQQVANSLFVGVFVASAFIIGSLVAIYVKYSPKIKGDFAAFGAGVFLAAIAFSLIDESLKQANVPTMIFGFALGAAVYSITNHYIRKKSKYKKEKQPKIGITAIKVMMMTKRRRGWPSGRLQPKRHCRHYP